MDAVTLQEEGAAVSRPIRRPMLPVPEGGVGMSEKSQIAVEKMEKLNALLEDLERGNLADTHRDAAGAFQVQPNARIDMPIPPGWVSCSGCGCWCTDGLGAGHGCGEHAGHWA